MILSQGRLTEFPLPDAAPLRDLTEAGTLSALGRLTLAVQG